MKKLLLLSSLTCMLTVSCNGSKSTGNGADVKDDGPYHYTNDKNSSDSAHHEDHAEPNESK